MPEALRLGLRLSLTVAAARRVRASGASESPSSRTSMTVAEEESPSESCIEGSCERAVREKARGVSDGAVVMDMGHSPPLYADHASDTEGAAGRLASGS